MFGKHGNINYMIIWYFKTYTMWKLSRTKITAMNSLPWYEISIVQLGPVGWSYV